eukprot:CAMPEP_0194136046 /NCGR_PEP_ID=MMETSP0152-20130528/6084_1 /TAXON_ID=1049557 /ORGANISM="Thalassiothrix antarctica, Strain L6-D1" /LENGTH=258 /DNA_ID=CAMNT_0038832535 /DNA_START=87 /DNA_END=863 /DNA_ORIENTATION=+
MFPIILSLILLKSIKKTSLRNTLSTLKELRRIIGVASKKPAPSYSQYQDKDLLAKIWKQPSALPYVTQNALEYQKREGYCGRSTMRNMLKSYASFPKALIPEPTSKPANPESWAKVIHDLAEGNDEKMPLVETKIVRGDVSFEEFMDTIRSALIDPSCRIAVNYLRQALFGFGSMSWLPGNYTLSLIGGHFSPIIGIHKGDANKGEECMIAVFDVNHAYGGAYLVSARMLHESVRVTDFTTQKSRALVVLTVGDDKTQ